MQFWLKHSTTGANKEIDLKFLKVRWQLLLS